MASSLDKVSMKPWCSVTWGTATSPSPRFNTQPRVRLAPGSHLMAPILLSSVRSLSTVCLRQSVPTRLGQYQSTSTPRCQEDMLFTFRSSPMEAQRYSTLSPPVPTTLRHCLNFKALTERGRSMTTARRSTLAMSTPDLSAT